MDRKTWRRYVVGAYVVGLLVLMFMPAPPTPSYLPVYSDKIVHVVLFFGLAALSCWSNPGGQRASVAWIVAACAGLAAAIEVVQSLLGYRTGDPMDFLAGTLGAVVGAAAARFVMGGAALR